MIRAIYRVVFSLCMMASGASAQSNPATNVFFGFDFVMHPIAIKWACNGARDQDLAVIEKLISAFPADAKSADFRMYIDAIQQVSEGDEGLTQIWGSELTDEQTERLCNVALPLNITWVTPELLVNDDEGEISPEQTVAWAEFWQVVESLQ